MSNSTFSWMIHINKMNYLSIVNVAVWLWVSSLHFEMAILGDRRPIWSIPTELCAPLGCIICSDQFSDRPIDLSINLTSILVNRLSCASLTHSQRMLAGWPVWFDSAFCSVCHSIGKFDFDALQKWNFRVCVSVCNAITKPPSAERTSSGNIVTVLIIANFVLLY